MRQLVAGIFAAAVALGAAWWLSGSHDGTLSTSMQSDRAMPAAPSPKHAAPAAAAATDKPEDTAGIAFTTLLLPDRQIGALTDSVRIGIAKVAPEDASAWQAWVDGGREGAGPASLAELASVESWIKAPAQQRADGTVTVGPLRLPPADRYDLQARGSGLLHFYAASFTTDSIPAGIAPKVAAGLRVHRKPMQGSDVRVLLRRSGDAEWSTWQDLLAREAPQLLGAFDDAAIAVEPVHDLAPMPPTTIEVILLVDGIEAERRALALVAGAISDLVFDPLAQEVARALALELRLQFVVTGSGKPIENLAVTRIADGGDQLRSTDGRGVAVFKGVDRQRVQRFNLQFPPGDTALPAWPESKSLEVALADEPIAADARVWSRTFELRPLQWLTVRLPFPVPTQRQRGNPYPIFVLQREQDGRWLDTAADHFIPVADGIAVSLAEPNRYRLVALRSPWSLLNSATADARKAALDGQYRVDLGSDAGRSVELTVLHRGLPLARAPIALRGPVRGLPPLTTDSDADGRVRLNGVTVPKLQLEVAGYREIEVDVQATSAVVELSLDPEFRSD
jgi:hypothetical protein